MNRIDPSPGPLFPPAFENLETQMTSEANLPPGTAPEPGRADGQRPQSQAAANSTAPPAARRMIVDSSARWVVTLYGLN